MAGSAARTEQVVAGSTREERATPVGVVAGLGDVLAGDPDRVAVHGGRPVVTPAGAWRVADLRLVAREAIVLRGTGSARDDAPWTDAGDRVDRRDGSARVEGVAGRSEGHHASPARGDPDRGIREVVPGRPEVALHGDLC